MSTLQEIVTIILKSLARVWPLLVVSIPFAVLLRASGLSHRLKGAFGRRPVVGILIATAAGAFGPFCSCTVIPVIVSMLIGGIPLPSVMAFWVASPTMDPEIFFMSAAFLGWNLAVARLVAALIVSMSAGFVALWLVQRGWIGTDYLRVGADSSTASVSTWARLRSLVHRIQSAAKPRTGIGDATSADGTAPPASDCCSESPAASVASTAASVAREPDAKVEVSRLRAILKDTVHVMLWVIRLMILAFALEAVILTFVPQEDIVQWISRDNSFAPLLAALVGVPLYTGNMTAIPLVGGLLQLGMGSGAALAFLIAGPITTIPAMAAVWGVVRRRVFLVYLGVGFAGALLLGYGYRIVSLAG